MPWQFGVVDTGAGGLMTITQRPASGAGYGCERALGSSGRIVVDTMVCGGTSDGQA
jgi:hypothetical protein